MKINREKQEKCQVDPNLMTNTKVPSVAELYETAYHFYQGGQYAEAQYVFRLLTCLDTENPVHWMGLGSSLKMQNKYEEAVNAFSAAAVLEEVDSNPMSHAYAAECLYAIGDHERAKEALNSAKIIAKKKKVPGLIKQLKFLEERWFQKKE